MSNRDWKSRSRGSKKKKSKSSFTDKLAKTVKKDEEKTKSGGLSIDWLNHVKYFKPRKNNRYAFSWPCGKSDRKTRRHNTRKAPRYASRIKAAMSRDAKKVRKLIKRKDGSKSRRGLWDNIRAKKKRGEKMRKKGSKGAPTDKAIKRSQK